MQAAASGFQYVDTPPRRKPNKIQTMTQNLTIRTAFRFLLLSAWLVAATASHADDAVTPVGPTELFNGRDFTGWRFFMQGGADPAKTWSVENGLIHCSGKPTGFLRTEKSYKDYELTVEWRFVRIAPKQDNSGILVHMQPQDKIWPPCVQVQGKSGRQGDVFLMAGAEATEHLGKDANTALPFHGESHEKPVGEWNLIRVICKGDAVKVFVNGVESNAISGCTVTSGGIGIQSEGGELEIRRIAIDKLQ